MPRDKYETAQLKNQENFQQMRGGSHAKYGGGTREERDGTRLSF